MSEVNEESTDDEKTGDMGQCLRGEILLSGFIIKALHGKSQVFTLFLTLIVTL